MVEVVEVLHHSTDYPPVPTVVSDGAAPALTWKRAVIAPTRLASAEGATRLSRCSRGDRPKLRTFHYVRWVSLELLLDARTASCHGILFS